MCIRLRHANLSKHVRGVLNVWCVVRHCLQSLYVRL